MSNNSSAQYPKDHGTLVNRQEARNFMYRCLVAVGVKHDHALALAEVLELADYRGHYSHGLNRLEMYVRDVNAGITSKDGEPKVNKETPAIAHVDGCNLLGPVVGYFCTDLAIAKAKKLGIGMVVANNSNHYGIAGAYGLRAVDHGLIGMSFTNTWPFVLPTRAKQFALGTNPICLASPAKNGDSFVLDMATSVVAGGKIEIQNRKQEPIPCGWAADESGLPTTSGERVMNGGGLLPLGGPEVTSGYKGYGLAMMVEVLTGMLAGSQYGPNVRKYMDTTVEANLGQCFIAIDPQAFCPGFEDRMSDLMDTCRNLEPVDGQNEVLVAGDPERKHMAECDKIGGIRYHINQITNAKKLADRLQVEPMKTLD